MAEAEASLMEKVPLATTPVFSFADVEYADDTVIVVKTAEIASTLLQSLQTAAGERGLALNLDKTCEISINSDQRVVFLDGHQ
eukprot:4420841-Alexandrium_andersonii.AAC.1